jgi:tetratricopeptide (TPR) repeat protein
MLADRDRAVTRTLALLALLAAGHAWAQPVTSPADVPLADIHDDAKLAEILTAITQDPAIHVDDPKARQTAAALMTEGVKRLQVQAYDQALANFLEAYNRLPSPKILLDIAATLRAMGRLADAANTYQRYLTDPATGAERVGEVKGLLLALDQQLTILTVRVTPHGSELSIDAGPFVPVGSSLQTRVRAGTHAIRIRKGAAVSEVDVNTFEGETRDVSAIVQDDAPVTAAPPAPPAPAPDHAYGWLIQGRAYGTADGNGRERHVKADYSHDVAAYVPDGMDALQAAIAVPPEHIGTGVVAMMRIDGNHWKGFAGGLGITFPATENFEVEAEGMKSDVWGVYIGARYLFLTGFLRPYAAAGLPLFFFTDDSNNNQVGVGARAAGGIELVINGHFSLEGELGVEYYFNVAGVLYKMQSFEQTTFAPTLGVIGRL